MKRIHVIVLALAAVCSAHAQSLAFDGWQMDPITSTVRVELARVDMVWRVTDVDGEQWTQRFAVDGCDEGKGRLYMIEDDYSLTVDENFSWTRGSALSDIALTMCQLGGMH